VTEKMELPVVEVMGSESRELGGRVDPNQIAAQLKAVRDAFLSVLNQQEDAASFALKTVDVSLTVSASGSIGWVTASAQGSIALHFEPTHP
jgi:hypothetical protein